MSACYDDAFKLACEHNQVELYGEFLTKEMPDDETGNEFLSLAKYFENKNDRLLAGKYYYLGKQYRLVCKLD